MSGLPPRVDYRDSLFDRLVAVLADTTRRQYLFAVTAYLTGIAGLGLVFARELWAPMPDAVAVPTSILLMGLSFLSLFVVTLSGPVGG